MYTHSSDIQTIYATTAGAGEDPKQKDTKSRSSRDDGSQSTRKNSRKTIDDYTFADKSDKKAILG